MFKFSVFSFIFFAFGIGFSFGQDLETILKNADAQTVVYTEGFKDLITKETKTFESYKQNGDLSKRNIIESNFLVYQSERDASVVSEFRNVVKVDGKPVSEKNRTPEEFFSQIQKTGSVEKELEKVKKESLRFDKTLEIQGLTLLQAPVLSNNFRQFFEFDLLGKEKIGGREVYVIAYKQMRKSPYVLINEKGKSNDLSLSFDINLPGSIKKSDVFLSGKLWIDAENFQLRREERNLSARRENPVLLMKTDFEYQPSEYGFLVPKQITLVQFNTKNYRKNPSASIKDLQVSFDYSAFTKTNVEVEILDEEEPPQNK
jgi:hypothetical protein